MSFMDLVEKNRQREHELELERIKRRKTTMIMTGITAAALLVLKHK